MDPVQVFKALSDATRLRCMVLLAGNDELCVCEMTHALGLPQPKISHHLGGLRKTGLVTDRKAGLWTYYRINPELDPWVKELINTTTTGIRSQYPFAADGMALREMPNRPGAACCA